MNTRFDAYTATSKGVHPEVVRAVAQRYVDSGDEWKEGAGYHGFKVKESFRDNTGSEWASILYGGRHEGRVMLEVKGERTPQVVEDLRRTLPEHRCTRVDSCADFNAPGAWDTLLGAVLTVKKDHHLRGEKRGDWEFPEDGRTQYLGAPSSVVRARLYEKGKQPEYRYLGQFDLVRAEIQVRPKNAAREQYASFDPLQVWGASPFSRDLAAMILQAQVAPAPAGTVYRETQRDHAIRWACAQYGQHFLSLKQDLGDWECVGRMFEEIIAENAAAKRRSAKYK